VTHVDPPPHVRLSLPAVRESLPLIRHVVATLVEAQPLGPRRQEEILLALGAAAADAVRHAVRDGPPAEQIVIEGRVRPGKLVLTVIEEGPGSTPLVGTGDVPGSLALIGAVADRLELGSVTAGGAATRMSFCLSGPRAAG
jgi:anti-sigma regulatory factor (Ser/Thr protein kinase)